ncbi:hypothetical protein BC835DRAFT_1337785 [Cytidiella melzeri]|nr:hypothetical protein BC835DRAFT_1337785 [Cytidiella melzeri]
MAKRKLAPKPSAELEEQRHPSLYHPDGDMVISATSRTKSYIQLYRVDRRFLARHSLVFKDLLSLGEGSDNEEYDGAPKVHLHDVAEDVAGLLGALYNMATLPLTRLSPETPEKVQGIMRLAFKYDIEALRMVIIRHIEADWPKTLEEWRKRQDEKKAFIEDCQKETPSYLDIPFPEPASAIRFAIEFNIPSILPAAFYELAVAESNSPFIQWNCLSTADLLRVVAGKSIMAEQLVQHINTIELSGQDCCDNIDDLHCGNLAEYPSTDCTKAVAHCVMEMLRATKNDEASDPLKILSRFDCTHKYLVWCCEDVENVFSLKNITKS